jgi:hypothetical protein
MAPDRCAGWAIIRVAMSQRTFVVIALVVLVLELLALGRRPLPGPTTAEVEGIVARQLQAREGPVSDVRCVRRADDAATCVALMYGGMRTRVSTTIDRETGRVVAKVQR